MDLESLRKGMVASQDEAGIGTFAGLSKMLKGAGTPPAADPGTTKIPLTLLPAGTQPGQRISLTVTGIDPVTGTATVVPDAVQNAVAPAPETPGVQKQDAVDKAITMGPMDDLRTYLFQKTQEQEQ
jgi:hypothetical protein